MNNDITNWPDDESQDAKNQESTSLGQDLSESQQTSIENAEWWLQRKYRDQNGIELNVVGIVLLAFGIFYFATNSMHLIFITCLAINVLIHECGHYAAGRAFKCVIRKVSVFFVPAISYKENEISSYDPSTQTWRDTIWTLGVIPLGGYTSFESANSPMPEDWRRSPFINHKPAWQRLIINTAGILVNLLTFVVCLAINGFSLASSSNIWLNTMMYMSLSLSVLNLLPIYPLDGSAAVTSIYEIITGRKPSKAFMTVYIVVGIALLIYLFYINPSILNGLLRMLTGN